MSSEQEPLRNRDNLNHSLQHDLSALRHPNQPSPLFAQRMLHEAYLSWAEAGLNGGHTLLRDDWSFTFEDRQVFASMERQIRAEIAESLRVAGINPDDPQIHVRLLHHLVAISPETRERHVYVEILKDCTESVLAFRQTAQVFTTGPVALHVYAPDEDRPHQLVRLELVSNQAFCEGLRSIFYDLQVTRPAILTKSCAWRWALETISRQTSIGCEMGSSQKPGASGDMAERPVEYTGVQIVFHAADELQVDLTLQKRNYSVVLRHDQRRQQPDIITYVSSAHNAG